MSWPECIASCVGALSAFGAFVACMYFMTKSDKDDER